MKTHISYIYSTKTCFVFAQTSSAFSLFFSFFFSSFPTKTPFFNKRFQVPRKFSRTFSQSFTHYSTSSTRLRLRKFQNRQVSVYFISHLLCFWLVVDKLINYLGFWFSFAHPFLRKCIYRQYAIFIFALITTYGSVLNFVIFLCVSSSPFLIVRSSFSNPKCFQKQTPTLNLKMSIDNPNF